MADRPINPRNLVAAIEAALDAIDVAGEQRDKALRTYQDELAALLEHASDKDLPTAEQLLAVLRRRNPEAGI